MSKTYENKDTDAAAKAAAPKNCPFCHLEDRKILFKNDLACAFFDGFPVSPGHTLIVPFRHVQSFFALTMAERQAIDELILKCRDFLDIKYHPDGYNIGVTSTRAPDSR